MKGAFLLPVPRGAARSALFMSRRSRRARRRLARARSQPSTTPTSRRSRRRRKWRVGSFAALWISMSACIPTYMLASSLIGGGMNWSQAILTIFLGNLIVVIPMILNAHAGTNTESFPGLLPRLVRTAQTFPRCCARSSPAAGLAFRPGSAATRFTRSWRLLSRRWPHQGAATFLGITLPAVRLLPLFLGHQHAGGLQGHRLHPLAA